MSPAAPPRPSSADGDGKARRLDSDPNGGLRRLGMLSDVRERFGNDKIRRALNERREAGGGDIDPDRDRRARGERGDRRTEPAVGEHRGMQPSAQVAQVTDRPLSFLDRFGDRPSRVATELTARRCLQGDDHIDEPLLGPVMQVPAEATPLLQGSFDNPSPRGMKGLRPPAVRLGAPLLGDVMKHDHRPSLTGHAHGRRRVRNRHERSVPSDEPVLLDPHRHAGHSWTQQRTPRLRKRCPIRVGVVNGRVARAADQVIL